MRIDSAWVEELKRKGKALSGWERREQTRSFGRSVLQLFGHLLGTAFIYVTLFAMAWAIGYCSTWLNGIHPFDGDTFKFVSKVEAGILYGDTALCSIVSLVGMWRFCKDVMR
jgi:hypothetical protein